ncbi:MAG TPA: hypothetical protein VFM37_04560 [Pseudonocardiaceae bacterium]|nr:hypothetical protein [Pseudonocardiaceae bacterium]
MDDAHERVAESSARRHRPWSGTDVGDLAAAQTRGTRTRTRHQTDNSRTETDDTPKEWLRVGRPGGVAGVVGFATEPSVMPTLTRTETCNSRTETDDMRTETDDTPGGGGWWPELPDDSGLWAAATPAFSAEHVRRLELEQRGW